jgi:protein ImuB
LADASLRFFIALLFAGLHSPHPLPSEDALVDVARAFTPRVQAFGATAVLLDLQGLGRVWPAPVVLGQALLDTARQRRLEPHVALAWSRVAALVVARGRAGLTIVPAGQEAAALAPLPIALLEAAPETHELLLRWGLRTIGDLAVLPAAGLAARLGPEGPRLCRLSHGEDDLPLVPTPAPESFTLALDLDWPVDGLEPLAFLLGRVLEPLCAGLTARGRRAAGLTLDLKLVDGRLHSRTLKPAAPSAEPRTWRTLLLLDLETHSPGDAVHAITVTAEPTPARVVQFSLLDPAQPSPERLAETMARLHAWTTAGRGGAAALLDTHRPGAFAVGTFAPGPTSRGKKPRGTITAPFPARDSPPRVALRVIRPPLPANVVLRDGAPAFVAASGIRGAVVDRAGPWRASGDWWDVAWSREEWDVALEGKGVYRLFRDRLREAWFVEGELD